MSEDNWVDELIDSMAGSFDPTVRVKAEDMEDGNYGFKIVDMEITKIESTGAPIIRWTLKVTRSESVGLIGAMVERVSFFGQPMSLNILGSDLVTIGALDPSWRESKDPLSKTLVRAISKAIGTKFNARKKAATNAKTGKTYHNINIVSKAAPDLTNEPEMETPF